MSKQLQTKAELFLTALQRTGDMEAARRYSGATKDELASISEDKITEALALYDRDRIDNGLKLLRRARDLALLSDDPKVLIETASVLVPEIAVYPAEKAKARAKGEHSQPQVLLNISLGEMAERLQRALRDMGPANE